MRIQTKKDRRPNPRKHGHIPQFLPKELLETPPQKDYKKPRKKKEVQVLRTYYLAEVQP